MRAMTLRKPWPRNRLLLALPARVAKAIQPNLEPVELTHRDILIDADTALSHVYFPDEGVISVLAVYPDGTLIETATIGREGCTGFQAYFRARMSSMRLYVQVPGTAARMTRADFIAALGEHTAFAEIMHGYVQVFLEQVMISAGCNGTHDLTQRLARWLLMHHDRTDGDVLPMTHDLLAEMLGVQRPSVSHAVKRLNASGAIQSRRSKLLIKDRARLKRHSCECYDLLRHRIIHHLPKTYPEP